MTASNNQTTEHPGLPPAGLDVCLDRRQGALRILVSGELTLATVEELRGAIEEAEQSQGDAIVVDLTDLRFLDSTGLSVLLGAYTRGRENGHRISFLPSEHDSVRKLIALTGTGEMFG